MDFRPLTFFIKKGHISGMSPPYINCRNDLSQIIGKINKTKTNQIPITLIKSNGIII